MFPCCNSYASMLQTCVQMLQLFLNRDVASVFIVMLQVFKMYVASVSNLCCKCFRLFQTFCVANSSTGCCECFVYVLQMFCLLQEASVARG
jgi:hypothetical protein